MTHQISVRLSFNSQGSIFFCVHSYPAFRTTFRKKVTGRISQFVSDCVEAKRKFALDFFTERQPKTVKTASAHSKSTGLIFRS